MMWCSLLEQISPRFAKLVMTRYTLILSGREADAKEVSCGSVDDARNEAVRFLGAYLAEHPGFATEGHWRVDVHDEYGRSLLHVIVATVTPHSARLAEQTGSALPVRSLPIQASDHAPSGA
jgi:hypothetical protein